MAIRDGPREERQACEWGRPRPGGANPLRCYGCPQGALAFLLDHLVQGLPAEPEPVLHLLPNALRDLVVQDPPVGLVRHKLDAGLGRLARAAVVGLLWSGRCGASGQSGRHRRSSPAAGGLVSRSPHLAGLPDELVVSKGPGALAPALLVALERHPTQMPSQGTQSAIDRSVEQPEASTPMLQQRHAGPES